MILPAGQTRQKAMIKRAKNRFIWLDMEMTGLDPEICEILEIAVIISDNKLNVLAELPPVAIYHNLDRLKFNFEGDTKVEEKFIKAFTDSGLLDRVQKSNLSLEEAENKILAEIKKYCVEKECHLAGNTIWRDAMFIQKYMPKFWNYLHYRLLDVSSIKILRQYWYPDTPEFPKKELHDASEDIRESVEQLKYYRERLFKSQ